MASSGHVSGHEVSKWVGRGRAVVLLLWLVILSMVVSIIQFILLPVVRIFDPKLNSYHRINAYLCYFSCLPFFNVTVKGEKNYPTDRNLVLVSNHQSVLDAFVFAALGCQHNFKCTFKSEILMYPGIGWMLWLSGHIPVVRGNKSSGKQVVATAGDFVQSGVPVLFFPEATRRVDTAQGPLADFKPGAFKTAVERGADILPVTLSGARSLLPPFGFPSLGFGDVEITVHAPISTAGMQVRDAEGNFTDAVDNLRREAWHTIVGGLRDVDHEVIGSAAQRAKAAPGVKEPAQLAKGGPVPAKGAVSADAKPAAGGMSYAEAAAQPAGGARRRGRREE